MIVYELMHVYYLWENEPCGGCRELGFFSDLGRAKQAIDFYKSVVGYKDAPNAFTIRRRCVEETNDCCGELFEATVYAHDMDYEYEHDVELGLYSSREEAQRALKVFCAENQLLFEDSHLVIEEIVDRYIIDKRYCTEGFTVEAY